MGGTSNLRGADLELGIPVDELADGQATVGHFRGESVLLVRRGDEVRSVAATCSHYGGPLGEGLVVGNTVRCPWHHACFSLDSGEALAAPALNAIDTFATVRDGDRVRITGKGLGRARPTAVASPSAIVIVGAGAAGNAAAEMLRREGYAGKLTLVGADASVPYDRPNLSKDYLAGNAPEEWIPLRPGEFYAEQGIELRRGVAVTDLDAHNRTVTLAGGESLGWEALLLATGSVPRRLAISGAELPIVHTLRTLADSRALIARAETGRRAVIVGGGFIGLEVAASLRTRGLDVHVIAAESQPQGRVLGPELGAMIRTIHEEHGVVFHMEAKPAAITADGVSLADGSTLPADLVVMGVGVEPELALAEKAGLAVEGGVKVNAYLETSVPGIFAAGDIARWPDPHTGQAIRVEHWVVAERQGQTAARNMLGQKQPFRAVPFFWSVHYDVAISYLGHGDGWDHATIDGDPGERDCRVDYYKGARRVAVASVGRDGDSLRVEAEMQSAVGDPY